MFVSSEIDFLKMLFIVLIVIVSNSICMNQIGVHLNIFGCCVDLKIYFFKDSSTNQDQWGESSFSFIYDASHSKLLRKVTFIT